VGTDPTALATYYVDQLQPGLNVHTIHAEAEGLALLPHFEALLDRLAGRVEYVRLIDVANHLDVAALPVCAVRPGTTAGRAGTVAMQGPLPPAESGAAGPR
jgi:hypothetical protein